MKYNSLITEVNTLSHEVGKYMAEQQQQLRGNDIHTKGLHDYVTHVDKQSEKILIDGLSKLLPDAGFLVEENTVENAHKEYTWIIDPLDGTTNFIHGLPVFAISIALMRKDKIVLGSVLDVKANECFHAVKGGHAYCNDQSIKVSERKSLQESLLATGFPYNDFSAQKQYLNLLGYLMQNCRGIRRYGSAAIDLAWVACGRFDGFWEYSLKPWDVAAGSFIVQQAGGKCNDFSGGDNFLFGREIVCGNPEIHDDLLELVKQYLNKE